MADIVKAVRAKMLTVTAITDIVSTRIYPTHAEQNAALPYVLLKEIGNESVEHLEGTSGLSSTRLQFDCTAATYSAAFALREAVRQALHAWRGTSSSVTVRSSVQGSRFSIYLEPRDGSDQGKHVLGFDLVMTHTETALDS